MTDKTRSDFAHFELISTRWDDEDTYGHVNNVTYYSYFDTAVNAFLIKASGVDIRTLDQIGVVVESSCTFARELRFPHPVEVGLAVSKLGNSSIIYEVGIFQGDALEPAAVGRFVHVYVDRATRKVASIPEVIRQLVGQTLVLD